MERLTGPMAEALRRGRETFNARFAAARLADGRLDGEAFLHHLATTVDPIVRAVAAEFAEKADAATAALYDLSLELFAAGLLGPGAKDEAVADAWRRLLPRVPRLVAREPRRVAGCVTNAVCNLAAGPAAAAGGAARWVTAMADVGPAFPSVAALLDGGKVLAWRAGMPQYRQAALAAARELEPALAARALGFPEATAPAAIAAALGRLAEDPWLAPADALSGTRDPKRVRLVGTAGAFRGFGGAFLGPPAVAFADGRLLASDGESTWSLQADVFGSYLQRVDSRPFAPGASAPAGIEFGKGGALHWGEARAKFDELSDRSSVACDGRTLAVTVPTSHHVFLLARG